MKNNDVKITYEFLRVDSINIPDYQRGIIPTKIKTIINNFDDKKLGVLKISLRDGIYYIIDGQHRLIACKTLDHTYVMCEVHRGLTYEQEAIMFLEQHNNQTRVSTIDKFNAKVEAKKTQSMNIKAVVEKNGFTLTKGTTRYGIASVSKLEIIENDMGLDILDKTLDTIYKTWYGAASSTDSKILMAVALFIKNTKGFDSKAFIKKLSKIEPKLIIRMGDSDISNTGFERYYAVLNKYYSKGTRKSKKKAS